jgi:ATP-dependent helicase/nuclease subunit B
MGTISGSELDSWLSAGGLVVTSSERASRAMLRAYHRARQREGRTAWPAPEVMPWQAFVHRAWENSSRDARLVLNPPQELMLWKRIVAASGQPASVLDGPRRKLAALAMDAHAMLCSYAPQYLDPQRRAGWDQDAAVWSSWLAEFEAVCRNCDAISADRVAVDLPGLLDEREQRPPLLLIGFDRLTPTQRGVLDGWGQWRQPGFEEPAEDVRFFRAADARTEIAACAAFCRQILETGPNRRVLVIAQNQAERRGDLERALLRENDRGADLRFEFSLGVPLGQVAVARSAEMLLRWLDEALEERELDWLIAGGHTAADERETLELASAMHTIRRHGRQRAQWSLRTFASESAPLARPWAARMISAQERLSAASSHERSPLEWAQLATHLLEEAGWVGARPQSSEDFQAARRWSQVVEACGSLGFDGQRMSWSDFAGELRAALAETLFAPESEEAPIVIAGPAESAGLEADAIWFLGADENAWPANGTMNPLLPAAVQRDAGMPHGSAALDWELAQAITARLLKSAPEVRFSYAAQIEGADARPSRLVKQLAGPPEDLPGDLAAAPAAVPMTVACQESDPIPCEFAAADETPVGEAAPARVFGGASVITAQSQCPFKAFASARLGAETWEPAEPALTPAERGNLLHTVLHAVWAGPPQGLRSLADLRALGDLPEFVEEHVGRAMEQIPHRIREQMPARYRALEAARLKRLVTAWLEYESARAEFSVEATELEKPVVVAGLPLKLRLDRLDRLNDGTFLVIDYKTGLVTDRAWDLPRPEDPQLPLYAGFGLEKDQVLGGLVFAKVRSGTEMGFAGRVADATVTLLPDAGRTSALVKRPLEADQLMDWRDEIEILARDFLAGRADVDPREAAECERCGLHALCRIQELQPAFAEDEEEADA